MAHNTNISKIQIVANDFTGRDNELDFAIVTIEFPEGSHATFGVNSIGKSEFTIYFDCVADVAELGEMIKDAAYMENSSHD